MTLLVRAPRPRRALYGDRQEGSCTGVFLLSARIFYRKKLTFALI